MAEAFFVPIGQDLFEATELTRGPWHADAQHGGPPAALLGRALERCRPRSDAQVARVTLEILSPVPIGKLQVTAELLRPGRSVELLGAALHHDGRPVMRATAWRIRTADLDVEAGLEQAPPGPDTAKAEAFFRSAGVGYHTAMEMRFLRGAFLEQGPATVWMRMRYPLLPDEEPSPLARVLVAADSGNGVSGTLDFTRYLFVNPDLTVYLHRLPAGEWVCLDAVTTVQPSGIGLAEARIADVHGVIGRGLQSLFVARREVAVDPGRGNEMGAGEGRGER